jgi:hypothetical protein
MKTFVVTTVVMGVQANGTEVRGHGPERTVEADYYRVIDGTLYFRTERRGNEMYPALVRVIAPGFWAEVYEKKTLQERVEEVRNREYVHHDARDVDLTTCIGNPPGDLEGTFTRYRHGRPSGEWGASWDD